MGRAGGSELESGIACSPKQLDVHRVTHVLCITSSFHEGPQEAWPSPPHGHPRNSTRTP